MADDAMAGLFGEDEPDDSAAEHALYEQDGPDLFGMETEELILPGEPSPPDDPEMEIDLDQMDEIPIDPDDALPDDEPEESEESEPDAAAPVAAPPRPAAPQIAPDPQESVGRRPEAPLALYRRYRPETFDQVIGEEHVTEPLKRALLNNRVNHAYLFSGPRGCGKTTSARILARCLNCEQGPTPTPCGVCQSCRDLARGGSGSIDVIEIDAASHGGVDEARDLRERAFFAPVHSRYKIYIIDEAHMVTNAGFNALLKVVEEPPPHVKFIFATTEPEKVIGTIRSRTHHYPFRLVPPRTLTTYLGELCEAEGVQVDHSVLPLVVRAGAGSVRDSLSVLDQLLGGAGGEGVTYTQAASLLGYTPESLLDEIVDAFAAGDAQGVFACIDKVMEVGQDPRRFGEDLLRRLRDLIIVAAVPDALETGLVDVAADQAERLTTQAAGMGAGELTRAAEVIAQGLTDMRGTTAPRLHLELMCARVLLPGADVDARGVHARLDRLERRLQMVPGHPAADGRPSGEGAARPGSQRPRGEQPPGQPASPRRPAEAGSEAAAPWPGERPARQGPAAPDAPHRSAAAPVGRSASDGPGSPGGRGPQDAPGAIERHGAAPGAGPSPARESDDPARRRGRDEGAQPGPRPGSGASDPVQPGPGAGPNDGPGPDEPRSGGPAPDARHASGGAPDPRDAPDTRDAAGDAPASRNVPDPRDAAGNAPDPRPDTRRDPDASDASDPRNAPEPHPDAPNADPRPGGGNAPDPRGDSGPRHSGNAPDPRSAAEGGAPDRRPSGRRAPEGAAEPSRESAGWSVNVPQRREPVLEAPAAPTQRAAAPAASGGDPAQLSTADVRARWPEVLDAVRGRRRVTWIILRENAQVHAFADGVLTLALNNPGALESFSRGGSDQIVREAVLEVFGVAPTVQVVPGDGGPEVPPAAPPPGPPPRGPQTPPEPDDVAPNPYAEQARANIQRTQVGPTEEPETVESPDDITLDDEPLGSGELLAKVLGAELIGEEAPEP